MVSASIGPSVCHPARCILLYTLCARCYPVTLSTRLLACCLVDMAPTKLYVGNLSRYVHVPSRAISQPRRAWARGFQLASSYVHTSICLLASPKEDHRHRPHPGLPHCIR